MESIIQQLLVPDNQSIAEGNRRLREALKLDDAVPQLCSVMTQSPSPQVRQYAALLLRKKLGKSNTWSGLPPGTRQLIKEGSLEALVRESERLVQRAIAQLVASLAKHELGSGVTGSWPGLSQFLESRLTSPQHPDRLLGMYLLFVLAESTGGQMRLLGQFGKAFHRGLTQDSIDVGFYAVRAMTSMVPYVGSDEASIFQPLVAPIVDLIAKLVIEDQDKACEALEIFDELFDSEVAIVVPHIKPIVNLSLKIAAEASLTDALRVRAITFLGRVVRLKKKFILKNKLHALMIDVLFPIMSQITEDEDDGSSDSASPQMAACQTLDVMAVNLPPDKFLSSLLSHVRPALEGVDPGKRTAAFNAMAISAEGCSEHIRNKYLVGFLQVIGNGIKDGNQVVRNAALYALGQYSEYLQPEISEYASDVLPILFDYLDAHCLNVGSGKDPQDLDRIFYALEVFCENLTLKLVPFLPDLMRRLLHMLGDNFSVHTRELSISGIAAAASAVKQEILPYFDEVLGHLKKYLSADHDKDAQVLLTQSMETLGTLARSVGPTNFAPALAEECCKLGLDLMSNYDDPDVRKCVYALFASVAFVVKEKMTPLLPSITDMMLRSCASKEGVSFEVKDGDDLPLSDIEDDEDNEADISLGTEDSVSGDLEKGKTVMCVENAYMEEKEQAMLALKDICKYSGAAFFPYLNQSMEETWRLLPYPVADVRKAAVETITTFCIAYHNADSQSAKEAFTQATNTLVPKLCEIVREDEEVDVVCVCLDELANLLNECGNAVIKTSGHPEQIIQCVHLVMKSACKCMDSGEVDVEDEGAAIDVDDDDGQEAEQDELLFQYAGDIMPALGKAMTPSAFAPYFAGLLPHLLKKTKSSCTDCERSFGAGALAECMGPLKGALNPFVPTLLNTFSQLTKDQCEDVRNNSVFGLGEVALHGGPIVYESFPVILQTLSALLSREDNGRVIDQIVGAVCRLIVANHEIVPVKEVLPVMFRHLPLREDDEEYPIVLECLLKLYSAGEELILVNMHKILLMCGGIYSTDKCTNEEAEKSLVMLVQGFCRDMNTEFAAAVAQLPTNEAENIAKIVNRQ